METQWEDQVKFSRKLFLSYKNMKLVEKLKKIKLGKIRNHSRLFLLWTVWRRKCLKKVEKVEKVLCFGLWKSKQWKL